MAETKPTGNGENPSDNSPIRTITFKSPPSVPAHMMREPDCLGVISLAGKSAFKCQHPTLPARAFHVGSSAKAVGPRTVRVDLWRRAVVRCARLQSDAQHPGIPRCRDRYRAILAEQSSSFSSRTLQAVRRVPKYRAGGHKDADRQGPFWEQLQGSVFGFRLGTNGASLIRTCYAGC